MYLAYLVRLAGLPNSTTLTLTWKSVRGKATTLGKYEFYSFSLKVTVNWFLQRYAFLVILRKGRSLMGWEKDTSR